MAFSFIQAIDMRHASKHCCSNSCLEYAGRSNSVAASGVAPTKNSFSVSESCAHRGRVARQEYPFWRAPEPW
jgi:hypothetical protein